MKFNLRRGDIVYVDLNSSKGCVQRSVRPCIVVSNWKCNEYSPTINVIPCTSKTNKKWLPTHVNISEEDVRCRSFKAAIVLAEQVITVDRRQVLSKIGYVKDENKLSEIDDALRIQLGLTVERDERTETGNN